MTKRVAVLFVVTLVAVSPAMGASVLWDTSHGVVVSYEPSGLYQPLVNELGGYGFTFDTTSDGFLADDPAGYDVIVVGVGSAWTSSYSDAEVARIVDYVNAGGGLLILADNPACPNPNLQPVGTAFGIGLGVSSLDVGEMYSSDLDAHPVFDGVDEIFMQYGGEISASGASSVIAREEGSGKGIVAAGTSGAGRVVALGDINTFAELQYYDLGDNRLFSLNTFQYLAGEDAPVNPTPTVPAPAAVLLGTLGAGLVGWLRRRNTL